MTHHAFFSSLLLAGALLIAGCQNADPHHQSANPDLEVVRLQPGVWLHTSYNTFDGVLYPSNGLIVREDDHLVLLDSAWGAEATEALLVWIDEEIGLPVNRALSTHFHDDRTGGVAVLEAAGIPVWSHPMTQRLSAEEGNPVPPNALKGIEAPGSTTGFGTVEVFFPGGGHARDNIMVWLPEQKMLYGGCAVRELATDTLGNTADADLESWPKAIRQAQSHYPDARLVIPGHGEPGGPELLEHMHALFK